MSIWALADLHLSFGVPEKHMDVFGPEWENYTEKIEAAWRERVAPDDLVLIPGDISWAMHIEDAVPDLNWIGGLPGTKVLLRGNHDYWWHSLAKIEKILPPSCHLIQNNSFLWKDVGIAGARLWDVPGLNFNGYIEFKENVKSKKLTEFDTSEDKDKIFRRELSRLELSLKSLKSQVKTKIVMTHYPPIGAKLEETEVSHLLEKYGVNSCVFGHLHNVKQGIPLFGSLHGIRYELVACDYLNFVPLLIQK